MSGFGTTVGFLFSFLVIVSMMSYSFVVTNQNLQDNIELMHNNKDLFIKSQTSFSINTLYETGGTIKLSLENNGLYGFNFKEHSTNCFDLYVNDIYIPNDEFLFYINEPTANYYYIEPTEILIGDLIIDINEDQENIIKLISCDGQVYTYNINSENYNWYNPEYKKKVDFTIFNTESNNLVDTYFEIYLNESNFDFTKGTKDTIVFMLPIEENTVLNLPFNTYTQSVEDFSRYKNTVYLGDTLASESDDPTQTEGVLFDALNFDGSTDHLKILSDNTLEIEKEITISTWIKWNDLGNILQNIFTNGNTANSLTIINNGGADDNKIEFNLNIGGTKTLTSTSKLDTSWHYLTATYNGTIMKIYIDGQEDNSLSTSGDITTYSSDNFIGTNGAGGNFYNGIIDDFKVYNLAFNNSEIEQLYYNSLLFKELNYTVNKWNLINSTVNISIEIPSIRANDNISFDMYYYLLGDTFESTPVEEPPEEPSNEPDAVDDLSANFDNKEVDLIWTAPNDNGYAITKYVVEYGTVSSGLFDNSIDDDSTPNITISNLINDIEYQFRVFAVNSEGNSGNSNVVTSTPTGRFWMVADLATDLGTDGTANQGTTPVAYAELDYGIESTDSSSCISVRAKMTNRIIAQEYTPIYPSITEIETGITALISVDGGTNPITWVATLYEYNDTSGNVIQLGTATNISSSGGANTLSLTFNNNAFNVSSGNRLKIVFDASNGETNQIAELCYGIGTQSYLEFNLN